MKPISVLFLAALGACTVHEPPELVTAREAYRDVAAGPANQVVPAEVHKAAEALEQAEQAFADDPRGYHTRDLAYVAQRKAELASALGAIAVERKAQEIADAELLATQSVIVSEAREELGQTQQELEAARRTAAETAQRLSESEARAEETMKALAELAAVKEEARGLVITLSGSVLFRSAESVLMPEAMTRLDQVAQALLATPDRVLIIEGHTDAQGTDAYNLDLSRRRAEAVRTYLVQRGYKAALIEARGVGEGRPVADNESPEGRANNRRVEIVVEPVIGG